MMNIAGCRIFFAQAYADLQKERVQHVNRNRRGAVRSNLCKDLVNVRR